MEAKTYDFSGWATKNDIKCSDGVTIRHGAFADQDGQTVPLVWNHGHTSPENIIGRALLKNDNGGVRVFGTFNDTENGQTSKSLIQHGDITALSIYANHVRKKGSDVVHGMIREVSLVLAGANSGAVIDEVLAHGDDDDGEFILWNDSNEDSITTDLDEIAHAFNFKKKKDEDEEDTDNEEPEDDEDDSDDSEKDEDEDMEDERKKKLKHADDDNGGSGETIKDVFDTLSEKQKTAVYAVIGAALEGEGGDSDEEDNNVKHNVFDGDEREEVLVHADMEQIMADAKRTGSLKEAVLSHAEQLGVTEDELTHADTYGVQAIEALFPDAKYMNNGAPEFIKREMDWVPKVLNGAHHTPFSRIKSRFANITEDEARARGYIKGKLKKEEVFSLLKRETAPCTVYKKQKLDRDDIIDITDFDVVSWIKGEMRMMLDEELARAVLIGDGRLASDDDHINDQCIRPIWKEPDFYAIKVTITMPTSATDDDRSKAFIRACIKSRKLYKGSGNPTMFTTEDLISDMLLLEDGIGHMLYESEAQLATKCRVSNIVTVPLMEGQTDATLGDLGAIIVNMKDYVIGADKGGSVSMFDDFDIDYNQQKYLIETRCSGALIKPYSAIIISFKTGSVSQPTITFSGNGMSEFAIKPTND